MFNRIVIVKKDGLVMNKLLLKNPLIPKKNIKIINFNDVKKLDLISADLVITFGGDGTFIKAANLVEDSLIIGINSNPAKSEGALTSLTLEEIGKLDEVFKGNFSVITRHRAKIVLNGKLLEERALNEIYIGAASQFHTSRYTIKINKIEEEHRSSGIIVSTGTGSQAWFYSAGGEIFSYDEEKLAFIVREPYIGKRIFVPKILKGEIKKSEKLIIKSQRYSGGIIAINDSIYDFNKGDIVEIKLSNKPSRVIQLK